MFIAFKQHFYLLSIDFYQIRTKPHPSGLGIARKCVKMLL
jgi:hypothetical protein